MFSQTKGMAPLFEMLQATQSGEAKLSRASNCVQDVAAKGRDAAQVFVINFRVCTDSTTIPKILLLSAKHDMSNNSLSG